MPFFDLGHLAFEELLAPLMAIVFGEYGAQIVLFPELPDLHPVVFVLVIYLPVFFPKIKAVLRPLARLREAATLDLSFGRRRPHPPLRLLLPFLLLPLPPLLFALYVVGVHT